MSRNKDKKKIENSDEKSEQTNGKPQDGPAPVVEEKTAEETPLELPQEVRKQEEAPLESPREPEKTGEEEKPAPVIQASEDEFDAAPDVPAAQAADAEQEGLGSNSIGFIMMLTVLAMLIYFIWFNKSQGTQGPGTAASPPVASMAATEEDKLAKALSGVKDFQGPKTRMKLIDRLDSYKTDKEKPGKVKIEKQDWTVKPSEGMGGELRYYDVTFQWKENDTIVTFTWQIDTLANGVSPMNQAAKDLDAYDEKLWKELAGMPATPDATPSPTQVALASPTPVVPVPASPSPVDVSPSPQVTPPAPPTPPRASPTPVAVKTMAGGQKIDILPPELPTPPPAPPPPPPPRAGAPKAAAPAIPMVEFGDNFYQLTGIVAAGREKTAMLRMNRKSFPVSRGTKLENGWTVQAIGDNSVTLSDGTSTRTITMEQAAKVSIPVIEPETPGAYPKAGGKEKPAAGPKTVKGPPAIPPPGGMAPPVPPAPGETEAPRKAPAATPTEAPTVIPLE